jgi:hypothetical protein
MAITYYYPEKTIFPSYEFDSDGNVSNESGWEGNGNTDMELTGPCGTTEHGIYNAFSHNNQIIMFSEESPENEDIFFNLFTSYRSGESTYHANNQGRFAEGCPNGPNSAVEGGG